MQERSTRQLSIGAAGMRGMVGPGLTPGAACDFAAAFASMMEEDAPVLVGCDPRTSSEMLRSAVISSLAGCGCRVVDGGVLRQTPGKLGPVVDHHRSHLHHPLAEVRQRRQQVRPLLGVPEDAGLVFMGPVVLGEGRGV